MAFITASSVGGFFLCALLANKVFELTNCCRILANFPYKQTLSTCKSHSTQGSTHCSHYLILIFWQILENFSINEQYRAVALYFCR